MENLILLSYVTRERTEQNMETESFSEGLKLEKIINEVQID